MPLVKCISPHLNVINDNALIPTLPRSQSLPSLLSIEIRTGRWTTPFLQEPRSSIIFPPHAYQQHYRVEGHNDFSTENFTMFHS